MERIEQKNVMNGRLFAVLLMGFASGLPLALTGSTLQAWFTEARVDLATIGALSLLGLPYVLKFLWAPLMDHFSLPWLGKRRGWILLTQIGLVLMLYALANMQPGSQAFMMSIMALGVAFFSASQDIAIDAYRTHVLREEERGIGSAYFVFSYRVAFLVAGGFALLLADRIGWKYTYSIMAILLFLSMIPTLKSPTIQEATFVGQSVLQTIRQSIDNILSRERIVVLLLFLIFYKFGGALASQLITNFLLNGLGFTLTEVGIAYKIVGFFATIAGAFIGGLLLIRWNIYSALLLFGLAQAFSNLMFVVLAYVGKDFFLMVSAIFIEDFCSGLSTAALFAFLMMLCHKQYAATQFAVFSAITSLGRVLLGPVAAYMVSHYGWVEFYTWSFALSFIGISLLPFIKHEILAYAPANANL